MRSNLPSKNFHCTIQRALLCLLATAICFCAANAKAGGFVNDVTAINNVAKSVLMLEVFDEKSTPIASGSGFVAFNNGTLITNYHVIEEGSFIIANTDDGKQYKVSQVLCSNEEYDIAILAFDTSTNIAPLPLYCGDDLQRGEPVVAIGSPIGITNTVSKGNISALYSEIPWIQFTAPISHGSSGGVLLNDEGIVIGITSGGFETGEDLNIAVRASVAQAMYNVWDNKSHSFKDAPKASQIDYSTIQSKVVRGIDSLSDNAQWACPDCSNINTSLFCLQCGKARPEWTCSCGQQNISPFCGRCGSGITSLLAAFEAACSEKSTGNYQDALMAFSTLNNFESGTYDTSVGSHASATEQIQDCYYLFGKQLASSGEYSEAISAFMLSGKEYKDSAEQIKAAYYYCAESFLAEGKYEDASIAFANAEDYKDASERINEPYYAEAEIMLAQEQYQKASELFLKAGTYRDAPDRVHEPYYVQGKALMAAGSYTEALSAFNKCKYSSISELARALNQSNKDTITILYYADSEELIKQAHYFIGVEQYNNGEFESAIASFENAADYSDAAKKVVEVKYTKAVSYGDNKEYDKALKLLSEIPEYSLTKSKTEEYSYFAGIAALK